MEGPWKVTGESYGGSLEGDKEGHFRVTWRVIGRTTSTP